MRDPRRALSVAARPLRALSAAVRPLRPLGQVAWRAGRSARPVGRAFLGGKGRALRAVVVVVVAAIGWYLFIPQSHIERSLLSALVPVHTALAPKVPAKAKLSEAINPSQSTFRATRAAARRDPAHTGLYAREWYVVAQGPPEVGIVLQLLPDDATARRVFSAVVAELKTAPTLNQETPTAPEPFSVRGVAGSRGVSWILDDSTTPAHAPVGSSYTVVYRVGRAVVSELMVTTSAVRDTATVAADVRAGARLLARREPGFSMVRTTYPLVASLILAAIASAIAGGLVLLPEPVAARLERRRERRHERELRRAREQYLARGRRTVRRQRAPAWSQPRRR
jgi:hypothetical protein